MRQTYLAARGALRPGGSPHGQKSGPRAGWGLAVAVRREFFRGETLRRETPALPVEDWRYGGSHEALRGPVLVAVLGRPPHLPGQGRPGWTALSRLPTGRARAPDGRHHRRTEGETR
ncbi:hypothetical protein GCM10010502_60860 [Kitasatospora aureofaciens]|uniref:Uncharacterized protein n=1 Tax=Kitasatospora aureofaciens TaxID=1894 RepID=A0A8H9HXP7_KITAU|nr:hypothetical protein GCM10010502_60860 [Kitasatospora aureofaciens]